MWRGRARRTQPVMLMVRDNIQRWSNKICAPPWGLLNEEGAMGSNEEDMAKSALSQSLEMMMLPKLRMSRGSRPAHVPF